MIKTSKVTEVKKTSVNAKGNPHTSYITTVPKWFVNFFKLNKNSSLVWEEEDDGSARLTKNE